MVAKPGKQHYSVKQYLVLLQNTEQRLEYDQRTVIPLAIIEPVEEDK